MAGWNAAIPARPGALSRFKRCLDNQLVQSHQLIHTLDVLDCALVALKRTAALKADLLLSLSL